MTGDGSAHVNPTSAPRRDTELFLYAPPLNHWLRMIYAALLRIRCLLTCVDGVETMELEIPEEGVELLAANLRSKAVVITNTGAHALLIKEAGAVVAIAPAGGSVTLGSPGLLAISAVADPNDPTPQGAVPLGEITSGSAGTIGGTLWRYTPEPGAPELAVGDTVRKAGEEVTYEVGFVLVQFGTDYYFEIADNDSAFELGDDVEFIYPGDSATAVRYLRCECGDEEVVYATEPVGAFLL